MDKNKKYYWRHKKTRHFISDGLDEYTDTWVTGLPTGGIDDGDQVTKAELLCCG